MKKIALTATALSIFGILFFGIGNLYSEEFPQGTVILFGQANISGWDAWEASRIVLGQLTTESGDYLGQISDLVIDSENGRILEAVVSDVQGRGGEKISVPFSAVSHRGSDVFVFDKPEEYRWRFSDVGGSSFEEPYSQWAEIQFIYSASPTPTGTYHLSTLMGAPVQTPKGDEVGRVNDFVIDFSKNQLVYFVLSGVGEKEGKMVAVPFNELSKGSRNIFTLHTTKEKLMESPAFAWSDVSDRNYAENVYRYYGLQPYWSEE